MFREIRLASFLTAVAITMRATPTAAEIFTSSLKIERMVKEEESVLGELKRYIDTQYERLKSMSNFYLDRLRDTRLQLKSDIDLRHPNSVYKVIKQFASDYSNVLGEQFESFHGTVTNTGRRFLAGTDDVQGARKSLLRLQSVYNLNVMDMIKGDYLGYQGPQLDAVDAYKIGQSAFSDGGLNESLEWLNATLEIYNNTETHNQNNKPTIGAIKALMGRVHVYNGNVELAKALYNEAISLDPYSLDVRELQFELETQPRVQPPPEDKKFLRQTFSNLCSQEKSHDLKKPTYRRIFCRRREAGLPYYTFNEEILSISPFVSVIYSFLSDSETDHMKDLVKNKLLRGHVSGQKITELRISDVAWIEDGDSTAADSITKRIESVTGLYLSQNKPNGPFSSEPYQVVNYGLGGHYEFHWDPFPGNATDVVNGLRKSGERIATFLIYLSDVEKGGSTVFGQLGVSVAPVKNMALMWYNFDPAHNKDDMTLHGGCPVLIGEKWITNKFIWTHGNTFRRRCGLKPDATQLDIELDMKRGYK